LLDRTSSSLLRNSVIPVRAKILAKRHASANLEYVSGEIRAKDSSLA
jgi:hypothetical protein